MHHGPGQSFPFFCLSFLTLFKVSVQCVLDAETRIITIEKTSSYDNLLDQLNKEYGKRVDILSVEKNGKTIQSGINVPIDLSSQLSKSGGKKKSGPVLKFFLQISSSSLDFAQPSWRADSYVIFFFPIFLIHLIEFHPL